MAIRFHCRRCRQWLAIASRKAGTDIKCPRCGVFQTVPSEEAAAAAQAMEEVLAAEEGEPTEIVAEVAVCDASPLERGEPTTAEPGEEWVAGDVVNGLERPVPSGMILFPRRIIYAQAVLLAVLFVAAFGAGFLIGRGVTFVAGDSATPGGRVLVHGTLLYAPDAGKLAADIDAIVIVIPHDAAVENKISPRGLHPKAAADDSHTSVRAIRDLGGEFARADSAGAVSLVVPKRGEYYLLIVSNHAELPEGVEVNEADLSEIERFFSAADLLTHGHKYRWLSRAIGDDLSIDWNFGQSGKGDAHQ